MSADSGTIAAIMALTAMPVSSETLFLRMTNEAPLNITDPPRQLANIAPQLIAKLVSKPLLRRELLMQMVNFGNFLDIKCELKLQKEHGLSGQGYGVWQNLAETALSVLHNQAFHFHRIYIMQQPFVIRGTMQRAEAIGASKAAAALPQDVNWDALSYKVPPRGSAYFCLKNIQILQQLSEADIAVMDQVEVMIKSVLVGRFAQQRQIEQSQQDDMISDYQVFLESTIGGTLNETRKLSVISGGDADLITYVTSSAQAFVQGIIPGAISPAKISSCQDAVSMTQLQTTIRKVAEQQIYQISTAMTNPAARHGILKGGEEFQSNRWTPVQAASLHNAASITEQMMRYSKVSFNDDPYTPALQLGNQLTGGPNSLHQQRQLVQEGRTVQMTPIDNEILNQTLSLMLACIRIRFDATMQVKGEMVAQEDIDHLQILARLAPYCDPNSSSFFLKAAETLQRAMTGGHNQVILYGYGPAADVITQAVNMAIGRAEEICKSIQIFSADMQVGGELMKGFFEQCLLALCDRNRINREVRLRYARRAANYMAVIATAGAGVVADETVMQIQPGEEVTTEAPQLPPAAHDAILDA